MMIFSEKEIELINQYASRHPVILKLWEEYKSYNTDPAKIYYLALTDAIIEISKQIKSKLLNADDLYTKSILRLAETGDKVFNTLERGKLELNKTLEEGKSPNKTFKKHEGKVII